MKPRSLSKEFKISLTPAKSSSSSRDAESFASQLKDVIFPANPGSARRPLPRKVMPKTLHPGGRLVRCQNQFYSNSLFNGWALYPILRESPATLGRKTLYQTHFCLYLSLPRAHDYGSRLWMQTDWQTDSFVFMVSTKADSALPSFMNKIRELFDLGRSRLSRELLQCYLRATTWWTQQKYHKQLLEVRDWSDKMFAPDRHLVHKTPYPYGPYYVVDPQQGGPM